MAPDRLAPSVIITRSHRRTSAAEQAAPSLDVLGDEDRRGKPRTAQPALQWTSDRYPERKTATVERGVNTLTVPRYLSNRAP